MMAEYLPGIGLLLSLIRPESADYSLAIGGHSGAVPVYRPYDGIVSAGASATISFPDKIHHITSLNIMLFTASKNSTHKQSYTPSKYPHKIKITGHTTFVVL